MTLFLVRFAAVTAMFVAMLVVIGAKPLFVSSDGGMWMAYNYIAVIAINFLGLVAYDRMRGRP